MRITVDIPSMHAEFELRGNDYLVQWLPDFLQAWLDGDRSRLDWVNPMADIQVSMKADGMGHFWMTISKDELRSGEVVWGWSASGTVELDYATLQRFIPLLRAFIGSEHELEGTI